MNEPILVNEKAGNINYLDLGDRKIDHLMLEWYETNKRILHKKTVSGKEIVIKFMGRKLPLTEGDVLYEDENEIIVIGIICCDAIVIQPKNLFEAAAVCYEIGNKHLPLFYEGDELLVEFEEPLFQLLINMGFEPLKDKRKLLHPLKTSVSPHVNLSESMFFK